MRRHIGKLLELPIAPRQLGQEGVEPLLGAFVLRDVPRDAGQPNRRARYVPVHFAPRGEHTRRAVGPDDLVLGVVLQILFERGGHRARHAWAIVGMDEVKQVLEPAGKGPGLEAVQRMEKVVPDHRVVDQVPAPGPDT